MTNIQKTEYLLLINRRLHALDLPVLAGLGYSYSSSAYLTLNYILRRTSRNDITFPNWSDPIDSIIEQAKQLCEPTFTKVDKVCFNMLSSEFWLDKEHLVTVEAITADGINIQHGALTLTVDANRLWIKE